MAGSITVSSITLDSDNNFSIRSNTGATILSANGTGLITGIASGSSITNAQLTTPTITGNTSIDSGTLFVDATNDRVGVGTTNPTAKHHVVGGQSYVTGSASAGAYSRWYNNAQTTGDLQIGQGWDSGSDNVAVVLNNSNAALLFGTNGTERMRINSSGYVTKPYQVSAYAYANNQVIATVTETFVTFNNAPINDGNAFNTSTHRFTAPVAGKYLVLAQCEMQGTPQEVHCGIFVNGTSDAGQGIVNPYSQSGNKSASTSQDSSFRNAVLKLVAGDYIQIKTYHNSGSSATLSGDRTQIHVYLLG